MPQPSLLCTLAPACRVSSMFKALRDCLRRWEKGMLLVYSERWIRIWDSQSFVTRWSDNPVYVSIQAIWGPKIWRFLWGPVEGTLPWLLLVHSALLEYFIFYFLPFICSAKLFIIPISTFRGKGYLLPSLKTTACIGKLSSYRYSFQIPLISPLFALISLGVVAPCCY